MAVLQRLGLSSSSDCSPPGDDNGIRCQGGPWVQDGPAGRRRLERGSASGGEKAPQL